ncbi:hypothetical protein [Novosphingobium huizhouense]|uniref:hypothetical protein n=1 Tax=Novosphingobium huizhouense TaxID=2866625 RepID=UPI001CD83AC2|nr:hypothetical protein [Novosphingobium huizhouense]
MAQSLAERFRAAREAFEAGMKLGCTPREAQARLRWEETHRRLEARKAQMDRVSRPIPITTACEVGAEGESDNLPWWKQEQGGMA